MLRSKLIKGVASGIGLASESISAYKAGKKDKASSPEGERSASPVSSAQHDTQTHEQLVHEQHEEEWELDEAQDELVGGSPPAYSPTHSDADQLVRSFLDNHPPPQYTPTSSPKLPYPVVLPQRRPKDSKRGFIRAYAPVLEKFDIDQAMFLEFLETSNKASQANPWINAINLASIGTMFMPSAIGMAVGIAIQLATDVALAIDGRRRTNSYMDKINEEMFRPRGLYCLIMTWNPESDSPYARFDLNSTIATSIDHGGEGWTKKLKHKLKSSSGNTYSFPETAPLVFPGLDELAAQGGENAAQVKSPSKREFIGNYFDKRSQAQFTMENPDSELNMAPKPEFTSRYADPSHPANSGSLIALVTGGHVTEEHLGRGQRGAMYGRRPRREGLAGVRSRRGYPAEEYPDGYASPEAGAGLRGGMSRRRGDRRQGGLGGMAVGGVKKFMKKNVMYMMIVNLPTEQEMAEARAVLRD